MKSKKLATKKIRLSLLQKLAWFFAAGFLFVVIISHFPGLTNSNGELLGLFKIDPIDDIFHLISGLAAVVVALKGQTWCTWYFRIVGIPYAIDAVTGLFFSTEFLNFDVFTKGLGATNFTLTGFLNNLPHIVIAGLAYWFGFVLGKTDGK